MHNDSGLADPRFPSLFKRIKNANDKAYVASIIHWEPINTRFFVNDVAGIDLKISGLKDQAVTDKALEVLQNTSADFVFLHLDDPDEVGHAHGFGDQYNEALRVADRQLGQLLDAVEQQEQKGDYLVLVTTDHGRDSNGRDHGSQTRSEKTIFIASNKILNAEFNEHINIENQDFDGLYGNAIQVSIAPTVLRHMRIEPQADDWLLDGIPLNGTLGIRKLMLCTRIFNPNDTALCWYSTDENLVSIQRNKVQVATVSAHQRIWFDPTPIDAIVDYTFTLNGTPVSLRKAKSNRQGLIFLNQ
jgi:hypothetical protein